MVRAKNTYIHAVVEKVQTYIVLRPWFHGCIRTPIVSRIIDLMRKQVITALTAWRQPFVITKWLPPCNKVRQFFDCLTIGVLIHPWNNGRINDLSLNFFNNRRNHPRMCILSTFFKQRWQTQSIWHTHMYICIYVYTHIYMLYKWHWEHLWWKFCWFQASVDADAIWCTGLILSLCPANEWRRFFVTMSLIGWMPA